MKRSIIRIDDALCNGCGQCVGGCPEGALRMIDGKARLVSELFCDGLGACIGECPVGAITVEEREAEPYDERRVMQNIARQGANTIKAHFDHLRSHGESAYLATAIEYLREQGLPVPEEPVAHSGCPSLRGFDFAGGKRAAPEPAFTTPAGQKSELRQWPIQLHLAMPTAPQFRGADVLLAADCTAFSAGDFHSKYLKNRALLIACPKLDEGTDRYVEKLAILFAQAGINTLTVLKMQVPCCSGLLQMAIEARRRASSNIPVKSITIDPQGQVLEEKWA
jgi:ferredoxin